MRDLYALIFLLSIVNFELVSADFKYAQTIYINGNWTGSTKIDSGGSMTLLSALPSAVTTNLTSYNVTVPEILKIDPSGNVDWMAQLIGMIHGGVAVDSGTHGEVFILLKLHMINNHDCFRKNKCYPLYNHDKSLNTIHIHKQDNSIFNYMITFLAPKHRWSSHLSDHKVLQIKTSAIHYIWFIFLQVYAAGATSVFNATIALKKMDGYGNEQWIRAKTYYSHNQSVQVRLHIILHTQIQFFCMQN